MRFETDSFLVNLQLIQVEWRRDSLLVTELTLVTVILGDGEWHRD